MDNEEQKKRMEEKQARIRAMDLAFIKLQPGLRRCTASGTSKKRPIPRVTLAGAGAMAKVLWSCTGSKQKRATRSESADPIKAAVPTPFVRRSLKRTFAVKVTSTRLPPLACNHQWHQHLKQKIDTKRQPRSTFKCHLCARVFMV